MKSLLHEGVPGTNTRSNSSSVAASAPGLARPAAPSSTVFGRPHDFLGNRFVYAVISSCARGLAVGVDLDPPASSDQAGREARLDVAVMILELERTLILVHSGGLGKLPQYQRVPPKLLELRQVTLSGHGEPTLGPEFVEAVEAVVHLRARGRFPFFKLVLITNGSGLDQPAVTEALGLFTLRDEVWVRLNPGAEDRPVQGGRPAPPLETVMAGILQLARRRPVVIQSCFPSVQGEVPPKAEIEAYLQRLRELKEAGAQIPLVQICSPRPTALPEQGHLPLRTLSDIALQVREASGLKAEVF